MPLFKELNRSSDGLVTYVRLAKIDESRTRMNRFSKRIFLAMGILSGMCLAGCASDQNAILQSANQTVQLMKVGPIGEYDSRSMPHALGAGGPTFGSIASQYRWVHVQAITKVDRDTYIHTIARVPDNIPQLHSGDIVDVVFLTISDSNFDKGESSVVFRVVCRNDAIFSACRKQLYHDAGNTAVFLGPTGEPVPDMSGYTFSKYFDVDGTILPGVKLPQ
jgi:hypothetical protein